MILRMTVDRKILVAYKDWNMLSGNGWCES